MSIKKRIKEYIRDVQHYFGKGRKDQEYIDIVCEATGWDRKKALDEMRKAAKMGISYKYYVKRKVWAKSEKELQKTLRNMKYVNERNEEERQHYIDSVIAATGWTENETLRNFYAARDICGCSFKDYYKFHLYAKTPEEQASFLTLQINEQLMFKYNKDPKAIKTLLYKTRFAKKFNDLFYRKWFVNRDLSFEAFLEAIDGVEDIICKPTSATQGKGVRKIHCGSGVTDEEKRAIYDELLAEKKRMICEECIIQHPDIAAFNPSSVNSLRILTILKDGKVHHVYGGLRMGQGKVVDNFHAGGIIATIDMATGITCMDAIDLEGNHYPEHPISKLPIEGFQIPHWDKVLELTEKAALRLPTVGIIGWDVAVTPDGACLIEGNSAASYTIIQLPYVASGVGMKKVFEPFLD